MPTRNTSASNMCLGDVEHGTENREHIEAFDRCLSEGNHLQVMLDLFQFDAKDLLLRQWAMGEASLNREVVG